MDAFAGASRLLERDAAHGGFGFFLDAGFTFDFATPPGEGETVLDGFLEFLVVRGLVGIGFAKRQRAIKERLLNFCEQLRNCRRNSLLRDERLAFFARAVAARRALRSSWRHLSGRVPCAAARRAFPNR